MLDKKLNLKSKLVLYIVVGIILIMTISTAIIISTVTSQEANLAYMQSIETANNYANQFDSDMSSHQAIGSTIAHSMSVYKSSSRDEVNSILENLLIENPSLIGTYVCYEPDAFDGRDNEFINKPGHDSTGRFIPYWNKINGPVRLDPLIDYETADYYQLPKQLQDEVITEAYYYEGAFIVSFVTPIFKDDEFIGIGGVDVSLEYIDDVVSPIQIFDSGYAIMTDKTATLLSHPENKEWIGSRTLYDFDIPEISEMADDIRRGKGGYIETIDPTTGKEVIMFYEPVETGNFSFILTVPLDEMLAGVTDLRNRMLLISSVAIIFMGTIAYIIANSFTNSIDQIVSGFRRVADDVVKGKLDTRADNNVDPDFKEIPDGLNEILDAVISPIRETVRVTNALADGKLESRVQMNVQGEFKQLGNTLDNFAIELNNIINDSNAVLVAFQKNDFKRGIQVEGNGDFKKLTDGIEEARLSLRRMTMEREMVEISLQNYAQQLERSNKLKEEMEKIIDRSPVVVFKWTPENNWPVEFVSDNISQFGYSKKEFETGKLTYGDILHPDDIPRVRSQLSKSCKSGLTEFKNEYRILKKDGDIRWIDERTFIKCSPEGELIQLQGIIFDITERKNAEEALLHAEEVRKKEIHHRIKNNLQVISSLLDLEADNFTDPEVIESFRNSQNRVVSMALIHEELHQSKDIEHVNFTDYIQNLTYSLFQSYRVNTDNIKLNLELEHIFLEMDTAIPLGIIINELISNSLKHAFSDTDDGMINIVLYFDKNENNHVLIVHDNGKGIPQNIDIQNTESLGLQLVTTLVNQIGGNVKLGNLAGARFEIRF